MKQKLKLIINQLNRIEELLINRDASNKMQELQPIPDSQFSPNEDLWMPKSDIDTRGNCQCK